MDFSICAVQELLKHASHLTFAVRSTELAACSLFGCHGNGIDVSLDNHYKC
jgi:hypothetical protein